MKISANSCNFLQRALNLQSDFNALLPSPTSTVRKSLLPFPRFNCLTAIYYYDSDHPATEKLRHSRSSRCLNSIWHGYSAWTTPVNVRAIKITNLSPSSSALIALGCISSAMGSAALHACVRIGLAHLLSPLHDPSRICVPSDRGIYIVENSSLRASSCIDCISYRDCGSSINARFLEKILKCAVSNVSDLLYTCNLLYAWM